MLYVLYVCICPPFLKWAAQGCKKEFQPKLTNKVVKYRIVKAALGLAIELLQERENSNILKLTTTEETSPPSLLPSLPTFLPPAPRSVASRIRLVRNLPGRSKIYIDAGAVCEKRLFHNSFPSLMADGWLWHLKISYSNNSSSFLPTAPLKSQWTPCFGLNLNYSV